MWTLTSTSYRSLGSVLICIVDMESGKGYIGGRRQTKPRFGAGRASCLVAPFATPIARSNAVRSDAGRIRRKWDERHVLDVWRHKGWLRPEWEVRHQSSDRLIPNTCPCLFSDCIQQEAFTPQDSKHHRGPAPRVMF